METAPLPSQHTWRPALLQVVSATLGLLVVTRMGVALSRGSRLTNESGIWSALAVDLAHGVLYRPLVGPLGIGGTRYFPLHVLLQGGLMRLGLHPVPAGFVIVVGSALAFVTGIYALARRIGARAGLAWPVAVLATGTGAAEYALTSIRGDLLPAALNVWGLAVVAAVLRSPGDQPAKLRSSAWAGTWFALAFLTKETTVFGLAAAVVVLAVSRRWAAAAAMAAVFAGVSGLVLGAVQLASHGNFLANLRACATGGRMLWMAKHLPQTVAGVCVDHDPVGATLILLGGAAFVAAPQRLWGGLAGAWLIATAAVTVVMFASPGVYVNHLLDVDVALLVFVAAAAVAAPAAERVASAGLAMFAVVALFHGYLGLLSDLPRREAGYRDVIRRATDPAAGPGRVLTDFELFSVLQDKQPVVLDDFMLAVLGEKIPAVWADLYARLDRAEFAAVIVKADPASPDRRRNWGPDFMSHLLGPYRLVIRQNQFTVYWRKSAGSPPASAATAAEPAVEPGR